MIQQDDSSLASAYAKILEEKRIQISSEKLEKIVCLIKERAHFISDFWELSDYFFEAPADYDSKASKNWKEDTSGLMKQVANIISKVEICSATAIELAVKSWMTENEIGMGKVMQPLRLSIVGALKGPDLFQIIEIIGQEETSKRIESAISAFSIA